MQKSTDLRFMDSKIIIANMAITMERQETHLYF